MASKLVGSLIAEELHCVAPLDKCQALRREALELDRANLGAVLFFLTTALRLLVVVELALDPIYRAMEDIGRRPEQVFEVGFERCVAQGGDDGVEDVRDSASDRPRLGERSRIRLVLEGTVTVELQFGQDQVGR